MKKRVLLGGCLLWVFAAASAVVARGDAVTVSVEGMHPGRTLPNVQQTLTLWHLAQGAFTNTVRNAEWDVTEFAEYVEIMGATGGSPERDCLRNPDDRTALDDYDFSRLVSGCRNIVRLGLKPYLKLGNVPGKFTSDYNGGDFAMNIRPPTDESAYVRYMTACAKALLDAFGREELLKWRFAVLTEYENAGWFKAASGSARKGVEVDAVAALLPDGGTLRIMVYAFRNEQFANGVTPFRIAVKLPAGLAGREIAVTRKQVDDDANWFDEWRAERAKRKIGDDRLGANVLERICESPQCNIGDIVDYVPNANPKRKAKDGK